MTVTGFDASIGSSPPLGVVPPAGQPPHSGARRSRRPAVELIGSAVAAVAAIWLIFTIAGLSAPFGLFLSSFLLFLVIYGVVCHSLYGTLVMKDRLATVAVWSGSLTALVALVAVIGFVMFKGAPVVFARFPHFLVSDMSNFGGVSPVTDAGVGAAIVGSLEQVGIATLISVPLAVLTATYLVNSGSLLSPRGAQRDRRHDGDAVDHCRNLHLHHPGEAARHQRARRLSGGPGPERAHATARHTAAVEVIIIVPGALRESALALGAPQWRVILQVVLPTARAGLITAAILGVARTAGETAEVLFTAGGNVHYNFSPLAPYQADLPLEIFSLINQPSVNAIRVAWGVAFVLVAVVLGLFVAAAPRAERGRAACPGACANTRHAKRHRHHDKGANLMTIANRRSERGGALARLLHLGGGVALAMTASVGGVVLTATPAVAAPTPINGGGSSFAAPAITSWDTEVAKAPYSLSVNYSTSSSGYGRYYFTNRDRRLRGDRHWLRQLERGHDATFVPL